MSIIRHNPWQGSPLLSDEMRQLISRFFGEEDSDQSNVVTSQWAPKVDIREEPERFVLSADIPGVDPSEIEIHMDKGMLTIKGERRTEKREENERMIRVERSYGAFHRRFALPESADPDRITATGRNGVLEITIPKRPESTPRRIAVQQ